MAKPVIQVFQSVLGSPQYQPYYFQPAATNAPDLWWIGGGHLPPGWVIDAQTGLIGGTATSPGVFNFGVQCSNTNPDATTSPSDLQFFCCGIEAAVLQTTSDVLLINIDIPSRQVTMLEDAKLDVYKSSNGARPAPIMFAKKNDIVIHKVRFTRGGDTLVDIPISKLTFGIKNLEPESLLVESSNFIRAGNASDGDLCYYVITSFDKPELAAALNDEEGDDATFFVGLGEYTWEFSNSIQPTLGNLLRTSTQTFGVALPRDIVTEDQ